MREILDKYTPDGRIEEMLHGFDTQICEALNFLLTLFAPKHKNFSRTRSLEFRKAHVICIHNDGWEFYCKSLLEDLGVNVTAPMERFLKSRSSAKTNRQERKKKVSVKKARAHGFATKVKEEIVKQRTDVAGYEMNYEINKKVNERKKK